MTAAKEHLIPKRDNTGLCMVSTGSAEQSMASQGMVQRAEWQEVQWTQKWPRCPERGSGFAYTYTKLVSFHFDRQIRDAI
jgi:hypothetical protein